MQTFGESLDLKKFNIYLLLNYHCYVENKGTFKASYSPEYFFLICLIFKLKICLHWLLSTKIRISNKNSLANFCIKTNFAMSIHSIHDKVNISAKV